MAKTHISRYFQFHYSKKNFQAKLCGLFGEVFFERNEKKTKIYHLISTVPRDEAFTSLARVTCRMRSHDNQDRFTGEWQRKSPINHF